MKRILPTLACAIALFGACLAPAAAQGLPGATAGRDGSAKSQPDREAMRERCKADPQKCREEMKARREERCKANPKQCEEMKAKMQQRREQCKADPQKCREEMKARREERCKANPKQCEEMKAKFKQRQEQCKADPSKCPSRGRGPDSK